MRMLLGIVLSIGLTASSFSQGSSAPFGFMPLDKMQVARVDEPADAAAAAKQLLDAGTDGVKVYAVTVGRNGLTLPEPAIQAVVKELRRLSDC